MKVMCPPPQARSTCVMGVMAKMTPTIIDGVCGKWAAIYWAKKGPKVVTIVEYSKTVKRINALGIALLVGLPVMVLPSTPSACSSSSYKLWASASSSSETLWVCTRWSRRGQLSPARKDISSARALVKVLLS